MVVEDDVEKPSFKRQTYNKSLPTNYTTSLLNVLTDLSPLSAELSNTTVSNHPITGYLNRLKRIYQLDIEILDQMANIIEGVNEKVVPQLSTVLEPVFAIQNDSRVDLRDTLDQVLKVLHSTTFHAGAYTSLGKLDFLEYGKPRYL